MTHSLPQLCARIKATAAKGDTATAKAKAADKSLDTLARQSTAYERDAERQYIACGRDLIALRKRLAVQTGNEKRVDFKRYVKAHCGISHATAYKCIRIAERKRSLTEHRTSDRAQKSRNRKAERTANGPLRNNNVRPFSAANGRSEIQNIAAWLDSAITPKVRERLGGAVASVVRRKNFNERERDSLILSITQLQNELVECIVALNSVRLTKEQRNGVAPLTLVASRG